MNSTPVVTGPATNPDGAKHPGGAIAPRDAYIVVIADRSDSMAGGKIQTLNSAMRDDIAVLNDMAQHLPELKVKMRVISFADDARWETPTAVPLKDYTWSDLTASGCTAMGHALELLAEDFGKTSDKERLYKPVVILLSDGQPTDDFDGGLNKLVNTYWGKTAFRLSIAIGDDADEGVLAKFNSPNVPVLKAGNPDQLRHHIDLASRAGLLSASTPRGNNSLVNTLNNANQSNQGNDVW